MPPREWNAQSYDRVSSPMDAMGREVLERLHLRGGERVLDAGCGTGRVTALLAEQAGDVVTVDGSTAMVEETRKRLGDRVDAFAADLIEFELDRPVDAILSTATFHWIKDHDALFARLHAALKPGGKLVAQCGGAGNIANVVAAVDAVGHPALQGWDGPWNYATTDDTEARLRKAGFTDVWTWPQAWPVEPEGPREYLATIILGSHLERLPDSERMPFVDAVRAQLGEPVRIEYVRLNILARRAS